MVIGGVQDSYSQFQFHLSAKLAREHPELSHELVAELLTRACGCKRLRHSVVTCLVPWAENLTLPATGWRVRADRDVLNRV